MLNTLRIIGVAVLLGLPAQAATNLGLRYAVVNTNGAFTVPTNVAAANGLTTQAQLLALSNLLSGASRAYNLKVSNSLAVYSGANTNAYARTLLITNNNIYASNLFVNGDLAASSNWVYTYVLNALVSSSNGVPMEVVNLVSNFLETTKQPATFNLTNWSGLATSILGNYALTGALASATNTIALSVGLNSTNYANTVAANASNSAIIWASNNLTAGITQGTLDATNTAILRTLTNYSASLSNTIVLTNGILATNYALTVGGNATNYALALGGNGTNYALTIGGNATNYANSVGNLLTNLIVSTSNTVLHSASNYTYGVSNFVIAVSNLVGPASNGVLNNIWSSNYLTALGLKTTSIILTNLTVSNSFEVWTLAPVSSSTDGSSELVQNPTFTISASPWNLSVSPSTVYWSSDYGGSTIFMDLWRSPYSGTISQSGISVTAGKTYRVRVTGVTPTEAVAYTNTTITIGSSAQTSTIWPVDWTYDYVAPSTTAIGVTINVEMASGLRNGFASSQGWIRSVSIKELVSTLGWTKTFWVTNGQAVSIDYAGNGYNLTNLNLGGSSNAILNAASNYTWNASNSVLHSASNYTRGVSNFVIAVSNYVNSTSNTIVLTNGILATNYALSLGANATNYINSLSNTIVLTNGILATNYANAIAANGTNFTISTSNLVFHASSNYVNGISNTIVLTNGILATNYALTIGLNATNYALSLGANATNYALAIGLNATNYATAIGAASTNYTLTIGGYGTNYATATTNALSSIAWSNAALFASTGSVIRASNYLSATKMPSNSVLKTWSVTPSYTVVPTDIGIIYDSSGYSQPLLGYTLPAGTLCYYNNVNSPVEYLQTPNLTASGWFQIPGGGPGSVEAQGGPDTQNGSYITVYPLAPGSYVYTNLNNLLGSNFATIAGLNLSSNYLSATKMPSNATLLAWSVTPTNKVFPHVAAAPGFDTAGFSYQVPWPTYGAGMLVYVHLAAGENLSTPYYSTTDEWIILGDGSTEGEGLVVIQGPQDSPCYSTVTVYPFMTGGQVYTNYLSKALFDARTNDWLHTNGGFILGNLGINTNTPEAKLHIKSQYEGIGDTLGAFLITSPSITNRLKINVDSGDRTEIRAYNTEAGDSVAKLLLQPYGGKVGIGTTNPVTPFDLHGGANVHHTSLRNSYGQFRFAADPSFNYLESTTTDDDAVKNLYIGGMGVNAVAQMQLHADSILMRGVPSIDGRGNVLAYADPIWNCNNFMYGKSLALMDLFNSLACADAKYTVTQTGFDTFSAYNMFGGNMENLSSFVQSNTTAVVSIGLLTKSEFPWHGIIYPEGKIYVHSYSYAPPYLPPVTIAGRVQNYLGNWENMVSPVQMNGSSWSITVPGSLNYITNIELSITTSVTNGSYIALIEYFQNRPNGAYWSIPNKYQHEKLYRQWTWNDGNNSPVIVLNPNGYSSINGRFGLRNTAPSSMLDVIGNYTSPSLNANDEVVAQFRTQTHVQMAVSIQAAAPYTTSLQVKHATGNGSAYPMALNPLGGNVGIGTTNPIAQLHVSGTSEVTATLPDAGARGGSLFLSSDNVAVGSGGALLLGSKTDAGEYYPQAAIKTLLGDGTAQGIGALAFSTRAGTAATALTERMRIMHNGTINMGATANLSGGAGVLNVGDGGGGVAAPDLGNAGGILTLSSDSGRFGMVMGSGSSGDGYIQAQRFDGNGTVYNLALQSKGGNVNVGNVSYPSAALLQVAGSIKYDKYYANTYYTQFANETANQKVDLCLTGIQEFSGLLRVTIVGNYWYGCSMGFLTKEFGLGVASNNVQYANSSRYSDSLGYTAEYFAIGEFTWDNTNHRWRIPIISRTSAGNPIEVFVEVIGATEPSVINAASLALSAVYTTDTTVYSKAYITFPDMVLFGNNVGIRSQTPISPLTVTSVEALLPSGGKVQRWQYYDDPSSASYNLELNTHVTSGNVRWSFDQTNANYYYPNVLLLDNGKVGIGTADPSQKLDVDGNIIAWNAYLRGSSPFVALTDGQEVNPKQVQIMMDTNIPALTVEAIHQNVAYMPIVLHPTHGNVGIGTNAPSAKLEVRGDIKSYGLTVNESLFMHGSNMVVSNTMMGFSGPTAGFSLPTSAGRSSPDSYSTEVNYESGLMFGPGEVVDIALSDGYYYWQKGSATYTMEGKSLGGPAQMTDSGYFTVSSSDLRFTGRGSALADDAVYAATAEVPESYGGDNLVSGQTFDNMGVYNFSAPAGYYHWEKAGTDTAIYGSFGVLYDTGYFTSDGSDMQLTGEPEIGISSSVYAATETVPASYDTGVNYGPFETSYPAGDPTAIGITLSAGYYYWQKGTYDESIYGSFGTIMSSGYFTSDGSEISAVGVSGAYLDGAIYDATAATLVHGATWITNSATSIFGSSVAVQVSTGVTNAVAHLVTEEDLNEKLGITQDITLPGGGVLHVTNGIIKAYTAP